MAVCVILGAWELAVELGSLSRFKFPPPSRVATAAFELVASGFPEGVRLWTHVAVTFGRILAGFVLALALAIPLGLLIGASPRLDAMTHPIVTFARSVATLSLLPLVIVWFGTGELTRILLIAYGCFWVTLSNVIAGVKYVDPVLIAAARTMDVPRSEMFTRIVIPAALPRIFAGARIGLGVGFMVIVGAEMVGTIRGLGSLIMEARTFYRSDITLVGMMVLALLGLAMSGLLRLAEHRFLPWQANLDAVRR